MRSLTGERLRSLALPEQPAFISETPALKRARDRVEQLLGSSRAEVPRAEDLRQLARDLWSAYCEQKPFSWRPSRILRMSPWAVLGPYHPNGGALGSDSKFFAWYLRSVKSEQKPRAYLAMAYAYLYYFQPDNKKQQLLRDVALEGLSSFDHLPRPGYFLSLNQSYGFLDSRGQERFARKFKETDLEATTFLQDAGLGGSMSDSGFVVCAFETVINDTKYDLT